MKTTTARRRARVAWLLLGGLIGLSALTVTMLSRQTPAPAAVGLAAAGVAQEAAPSLQGAPKSPAAEYVPDVRFRLQTALAEGKLAFVGVGGDIDGVVNPTLRVPEGAVVQVNLLIDNSNQTIGIRCAKRAELPTGVA
jgi:nitrite reductase (NO-forming)